jgi:hypothetical protein
MKSTIRKPFAVLTSAALGVTLLFSSGTATVSAEEALKLTFPDIASTHWARSHVAKLAAAGIVKGYTTGNYQPSKDVTQQEAIVMVIRMVGLEDEALAMSGDAVTGLGEDKFFSKYVVKAAEKRIINLGEETFAAASGSTPWGSRPASREWVAKLVVRAIGELPNAANGLTFADASQVSSAAAGYVSKSQELELVTGFTDNTFKPKNAVTRAQLATILSRSDKYIPDDTSRNVSGYITSRTGTSLQVQTKSGAATAFALNAETLVFDTNGNAAGLSDLSERMMVRVIYHGSEAYYIEVSDETVEMESIDGELTAIDIANMSLVLTLSNGSVQPYTLASNATVTDAQGSGLPLSQLTEGSDVRLQRVAGTEEASALIVLEAAYNESGTGVVQSVNVAERKVTFTNGKGSLVTYPVASNAKLTVKGVALDSLNGLQVGDTFAYGIKDSVLADVDITIQKYVTAVGEFQSYAGGANPTITILVNGTKPEAYLMKNGAVVEIPGLSAAGLGDLRSGDVVQLRISGANQQVERVAVTNRDVTVLRSVKIDRLENDYLTVRDEKGKAHFFEINDRSQFMLDGDVLQKSLFSLYLTPNRTVNLQVTADQLVRLDVITKVSGSITAINTATRMITVKTGTEAAVSVPYASTVLVEVPRQTSASMTDVTVGSNVEMFMGSNMDAVTSIQLERSFIFIPTSFNATSKTIIAKDAQGASVTLTLDASALIQNSSGQNVTLSAFTPGHPIVVNYMGRKIVSVKEAAVTLGTVTTLDVTGGKLAITDFNNNIRNYDLAKGISVQKGTTVYGSASALKLNDRVQIVSDGQGKAYATVADAEVRKFSSYDAAKSEVTLKIVKLGDQSKYTLAPNAHLHTSAGGLLALNRLKDNDMVTVYLLDGKIIELVQ